MSSLETSWLVIPLRIVPDHLRSIGETKTRRKLKSAMSPEDAAEGGSSREIVIQLSRSSLPALEPSDLLDPAAASPMTLRHALNWPK